MADARRKAQSTKLAQPVPVEFQQIFVQHGWDRVNHLFGKRASVRFFTVLGADRLRDERHAYLSERRGGGNFRPYHAARDRKVYDLNMRTPINGGEAVAADDWAGGL